MVDGDSDRAVSIELIREDYRASAALAWVATGDFARVEETAETFLHPAERECFRAYRFEKRRASYLLGRYAAKAALRALTGGGFSASAVEIASGVFGQPVVRGEGGRGLQVSISHSDRLVCGLAFPEEHPMAVDAEEIDAKRTPVMLTQIGSQERDAAVAVCGDIDVAATVIWAAKEALSKSLRCGMTCPYELLETAAFQTREDGFGGLFRNFGQYRFHAWRRKSSVVAVVLPKKTQLQVALPDSFA